MRNDEIKAGIFKNKWFRLGCFAVVFVGYAVTLSLLNNTACLSKLLFGVPCPGCGLTRANLAALRFDFAAAFEMHPLWFYSILGGGLLVLAVAKPEIRRTKSFNLLCVVLAVILCAVFVVRMLTVAPNPPLDPTQDSLLGLIVKWLKSLFGK